MQLFPSRLRRPSSLAFTVALLAAGGLLGACDRHSAQELPDSYGHGSGHQKQYDLHEPDSRDGSQHFSDSKGVNPGGEGETANATPAPKPGETAAAPMFPGGH